MLLFTHESLPAIYHQLEAQLADQPPHSTLHFVAPDPDLSLQHYSGETIMIGGRTCTYRSYEAWTELAAELGCRMLRPFPHEQEGFVELRYYKLDLSETWHSQSRSSGDPEKYGSDTDFARLDKLEQPSFLVAYLEALRSLPLPPNARILNAGINKGDEFAAFAHIYTPEACAQMRFVGLDHAASAITAAQQRFRAANFDFQVADLNDPTVLVPCDLFVSIGTLHSPKLNGQALFRSLVKEYLAPTGSVILGFPNCRYVDHTLQFGAKVRNYRRPELSLLLKDVITYKRYLQQQRFRVTLTGKHTLFLTATRLPRT